jgi:hypothetical protein
MIITKHHIIRRRRRQRRRRRRRRRRKRKRKRKRQRQRQRQKHQYTTAGHVIQYNTIHHEYTGTVLILTFSCRERCEKEITMHVTTYKIRIIYFNLSTLQHQPLTVVQTMIRFFTFLLACYFIFQPLTVYDDSSVH